MPFVTGPETQPGVADGIRAVFDAPDRPEGGRRPEIVANRHRLTDPSLASRLGESIPQRLTAFAPPARHRRRLRTSNMPGRIDEEIRRRTRVAGLSPCDSSVPRPFTAVRMKISEDRESNRRYSMTGTGRPDRLQAWKL